MLHTSYCFKGWTKERHNICKFSQCSCGHQPRQPEDRGGQAHRFISCSLIHRKTLRKRWIDSHLFDSHMKAPSQLFHCNYHLPNYPGVHTFPNKQLKIERKKRNQWRYSDEVCRQSDVENFIWEWFSGRHDSEPKEKSNYLVLPGAVQD